MQIEVFPNPFSEQTTLRLNGLELENAQLDLFNVSGQLLATHTFSGQQFTLKNDLSAGLYFYQIKMDGRMIATGKLVAE